MKESFNMNYGSKDMQKQFPESIGCPHQVLIPVFDLVSGRWIKKIPIIPI